MSISSDKPKIIAVVGMSGSGKGTVVEYLTNKLVRMSIGLTVSK